MTSTVSDYQSSFTVPATFLVKKIWVKLWFALRELDLADKKCHTSIYIIDIHNNMNVVYCTLRLMYHPHYEQKLVWCFIIYF